MRKRQGGEGSTKAGKARKEMVRKEMVKKGKGGQGGKAPERDWVIGGEAGVQRGGE